MTTVGDEPVLLVHGYGDGACTPWWRTLERRFRDAGYADDRVRTLGFGLPGTTLCSPRRYAGRVGRAVERLRDEHGSRVDVVAHSMGGLAARWYVEHAGGAANVDDLVTLGTPHQGSRLAYTQFTPGGVAMRPTSRLLADLNGSTPPRSVTYTALWSAADEVISPRANATLPFDRRNVTNRQTAGHGHLDLVSAGDVFEQYVGRL